MVIAALTATSGSAQPVDGETITSPEYARLLGALTIYQQIADSGGWPTVPAGPTIRPGAIDPRIVLLAGRLKATGDL